jgi:hypothetical protein
VSVAGDSLGIEAAGTVAVPLPSADAPVGVLSVFTATPGEPDEAQRSLQRVGGVGRRASGRWTRHAARPRHRGGVQRSLRTGELTVALAEAVTSRDVVRAVAEFVLAPFGADGLVFQVLEGDRLKVVGASGYSQHLLGLVDGIPLGAHA